MLAGWAPRVWVRRKSRGVGVAATTKLLLFLCAADAPPDSYTFAVPQRMLFAHTGSLARASPALGRQLYTHLSSQPGSSPDPSEAGGRQAASEGQAQGGGHRDQLLVAALKHVKTLVRLGSLP